MNVETNNHLKCTIALAALQSVLDPEIGLNVVDLGLIYKIDFDEIDKKVLVWMTLTTQFCPMGETIVNGIANALQSAFTNDDIVVEITFDPPWKYEMISEEGKQILNHR